MGQELLQVPSLGSSRVGRYAPGLLFEVEGLDGLEEGAGGGHGSILLLLREVRAGRG
ncbi:MAG: hypothetical protein H6Q00_2453 [Holophagaceae bacterium]|nr:hypothetical protein [Holophagaceae bacterium]